MADEFDFENDEMMPYDDDWIYVEDEFALADELAETQVADPGYAGTNNEIELESDEYDFFGYWDDVEYGFDEYWDYDVPQRPAQVERTGQKRKLRTSAKSPMVADKRRKISSELELRVHAQCGMYENVIFKTSTERSKLAFKAPPMIRDAHTYAFLPDWRERFAGEDGVIKLEEMPAEMQKAANADKERTLDGGEWAADDGEENGQEIVDMDVQLPSLDDETLQGFLKQKLREAGLHGPAESAFMRALQNSLASEDGAEDAAGDLANALLEQATQDGGDSSLSVWLERQGVSLSDAEADETSSVVTAGTLEGSTGLKSGRALQSSPPDSAVDVPTTKKTVGRTTEMPIHPSLSPPGEKDPAAAMAAKKGKGRKKVTFDVPPSSEPPATQNGGIGHGVEKAGSSTSDDSLLSVPTVPNTRTTRKRKNVTRNMCDEVNVDEKRGAVDEPATKRTRTARPKAGK